jgi:hypothetical protein
MYRFYENRCSVFQFQMWNIKLFSAALFEVCFAITLQWGYYQGYGDIIRVVGDIIRAVGILSGLWDYYQGYGTIIRVMGILSGLWGYYQGCGTIIRVMGILSGIRQARAHAPKHAQFSRILTAREQTHPEPD